jgi:hypothetical protein
MARDSDGRPSERIDAIDAIGSLNRRTTRIRSAAMKKKIAQHRPRGFADVARDARSGGLVRHLLHLQQGDRVLDFQTSLLEPRDLKFVVRRLRQQFVDQVVEIAVLDLQFDDAASNGVKIVLHPGNSPATLK